MYITPFNLQKMDVNPNDHSYNAIRLQTLVDVIVYPLIGNPSKTDRIIDGVTDKIILWMTYKFLWMRLLTEL